MNELNKDSLIRIYKDRFRIFLILYFFSDDYSNQETPRFRKLFKSEIRIQKIDFLVRNPDYFAYELLILAKDDKFDRSDIKAIVKEVFDTQEPIIRRLEMEKFFFGAYEDIDDVIGFLKSIDYIDFTSKKSIDLRTIDKQYFITETACSRVENNLTTLSSIQWYVRRCQIIKKYFGGLSGTDLKVMQYQIDEYRNTTHKEYINEIQDIVREKYRSLYGEEL